MIITKKRIYNPRPYLYPLSSGDMFYVATPINDADVSALLKYGFLKNSGIVTTPHIPLPVKNETQKNMYGYYVVHKNLPKEPRTFERSYHVVDWHGQDHYGTCYHTRDCYQRTLIPPSELEFTLDNNVVCSPILTNSERGMQDIKLAINILLEIFGRCEIWTNDKAPVKLPFKCIEVPWEILRSGTAGKKEWEHYVDETTKTVAKHQRSIIKQRHEYMREKNPDFCVLGIRNFWGYVVYGFTSLNLYIFECNRPDNATYVFRGNWEAASHLTKTDILCGNLHESRVFHTKNWRENLNMLLKGNN